MVQFLTNCPNVFCTLRISKVRSSSSLRLQNCRLGGVVCLDHVVEASKNPGTAYFSRSFLAEDTQTDCPNSTKSPQIFQSAY